MPMVPVAVVGEHRCGDKEPGGGKEQFLQHGNLLR
jgi:hypothetical protein